MKPKKKLPLVTYLCCLLAVSVLFTGATFSRYTQYVSGDVGSTLSPFVVSYDIDDISSTTFTNANYWLESGGAQGTARTVRFTLRNFVEGQFGVERISNVDLLATMRLYLPQELADNLVLQVVAVNADETQTAVTPQYVVGNLVYQVETNTTSSDDKFLGKYQYPNDTQTVATSNRTLDTSLMVDYTSVAGAADETLDVTGSIADNGSVSAFAQNGNGLEISSSSRIVDYSVGFRRGKDDSDLQPQLFVNLQKEITFYTIDIHLGGDRLFFEEAKATQRSFVLYMTLAERVHNDNDFRLDWQVSNLNYLLTPTAGSHFTLNGAKVLGYHFDATAPTYEFLGSHFAEVSQTTVRVDKTFGLNANGTYDGTVRTTYHHVAPISETAVNYVHAFEHFYNASGSPFAFDGQSLGGQQVFGVCTNYFEQLKLNSDGSLVSNEGAAHFVSFAELPDSPLFDTFANQQAANQTYSIYNSLSKTFLVDMTALFVQASASGGGA